MEWTALVRGEDLMGNVMTMLLMGGNSRLSFLRRLDCYILLRLRLFCILLMVFTF